MSDFKQYQRKGLSEMRPYIPGEDLTGISVSQTDTPELGGMIARNPKDHNDQWYVAKKYFDDNLEEVPGASTKTIGLTFGEATAAALEGKAVSRAGWNGQGMFAYIVPAAEYKAETEVARIHFGEKVPYRAYWALKTAQNDVAMWSPSGSDTLATDWIIIS